VDFFKVIEHIQSPLSPRVHYTNMFEDLSPRYINYVTNYVGLVFLLSV
jgi:hypothetical protein